MSTPKRIQMTRQRPWRAEHPDAVIVARPSKWGNPFRVGSHYETHRDADMIRTPERAVRDYRVWLTAHHPTVDAALVLDDLPELAGRDLACWCPLTSPCHADVLLELANPKETDPDA